MKDDVPANGQNDPAGLGELWGIYMREAQLYDENLVKSWKEDMDNMLVFSGLYSAILTAFVIESYQNLKPDHIEDSAVLLRCISQQLANPSNSSGLAPLPDGEFSPTSSALACNILWFISLALALTCAFLAMLVKQWSLRFLSRTSTVDVRLPNARALLRQYLYFGLKDYKMHAIVDLLPLLIHLSLLSFFGGLIGFLVDVNIVMTWLFAGVLGFVLVIYCTFTILPLVNLSSPYATPLSPLLWRIWGLLKTFQRSLCVRFFRNVEPPFQMKNRDPRVTEITTRLPNDEEAQPFSSITGKRTSLDIRLRLKRNKWSIVDASIQESQKRSHALESRSIIWTLGSLSNEADLLRFLEALPGVLLGGNLDCINEGNFHLMDAFLTAGDVQTNIVPRTLSLLENNKNLWYTDRYRKRCSVACAKTLYSLARVLVDKKYRARFADPTKCPSLFSDATATLERVTEGIRFVTLESEAFSNSVLVLCILSVLQSLRDRVKACTDQAIPRSWFQEAEMALDSHWATRIMIKRTFNPDIKFFTRSQAEAAIKEMISAPFYGYLYGAVRKPSFNLAHVCQLMVQNGSDFLEVKDPGLLFRFLSDNIQTCNERAVVERMDTIFGIALDCITASTRTRGQGDQQHKILEYITSRFRIGGWGSTKEIWSEPHRLLNLLEYLRTPERTLPDMFASALQELLLHITHERGDIVDSFLEHIFSRVQSQSRRENTLKSKLWILLVLVILNNSQDRDKEKSSSILDQIDRELRLDSQLDDIFTSPHIKAEVCPQSIVVLLCLNGQLPAQETREILQFYLRCFSSGYPRGVPVQPTLLNALVRHSGHFAALFLRTPSKEMMDITAMVWSFWVDILPEPEHARFFAEEQVNWLELRSLSDSANKLLSPEARKELEGKTAKLAPEQQLTILNHRDTKRLSLFDTLELVQQRLTMILKLKIHLLVPLPPADADEETQLAMKYGDF